MKITKYITIACIVTSLSGCDYLDFDESIGKTQDEMYTYFENISSMATYIYSQRLKITAPSAVLYGMRQPTMPYIPGTATVCTTSITVIGVHSIP